MFALLLKHGTWKYSRSVYYYSRIDGNLNPQIIKEISQINFPHLFEIFIYRNELESVEGLSRVEFPSLKLLSMGKNWNIQDKILFAR